MNLQELIRQCSPLEIHIQNPAIVVHRCPAGGIRRVSDCSALMADKDDAAKYAALIVHAVNLLPKVVNALTATEQSLDFALKGVLKDAPDPCVFRDTLKEIRAVLTEINNPQVPL